jgi:hypothetical protein
MCVVKPRRTETTAAILVSVNSVVRVYRQAESAVVWRRANEVVMDGLLTGRPLWQSVMALRRTMRAMRRS